MVVELSFETNLGFSAIPMSFYRTTFCCFGDGFSVCITRPVLSLVVHSMTEPFADIMGQKPRIHLFY